MDRDEISSCSDLSETSEYLTDSAIEDEDDAVDPQTLEKVKIGILRQRTNIPTTGTEDEIVEVTPKTALLRALQEAKIRCIFAEDLIEEADAQFMLETLKSKAQELARAPDSFDSDQEKAHFFRKVKRSVRQIIAVIKIQQHYDDILHRFEDDNLEQDLAEYRSEFAQDLVDRPWLQFMHSQAPAWPSTSDLAPNVIARQKIPDGGIRIINHWEGEVQPILDFLDTNNGVPLSFESGLVEAQKTVTYSPNGTRSKETHVGVVERAPFCYVYEEGMKCYDGDVFPLTRMLAPFERDFVPAGWSVATVTLKSVENGKRSDVRSIVGDVQASDAGEEIIM